MKLCLYPYSAGNRTQRSTLGSQAAYTHNKLNELTGDDNSADARGPQTFVFDAAGNRATQTFDGQARSYDHTNPLNQMEGFSGALGTASFEHDAEGNRITRTLDGQGTGYEWDGKNRLTKVTLSDTTTISYTYDYQNRRVKRVKGSETRAYLYGSGYEVLEEFINGQSLALNAWGPAGLASRRDAQGQTLFYLKDGLGSVLAIMDEKANIIQSYEYSAFGETLSGQDAVNSFRFVGGFGGQVDDATGLVYFWNRWYDPQVGKWVSEDPIRHFSTDLNFLRYSYNNPGAITDPNGLDPLIGGILGGLGGLINGLTQPCASLGDIGMAIAIGGTVGALVGLYDPTNIGAAAVAGLVSDLAVQALAGRGIIWNDAAYSAMSSAVAASVGRVAPVKEAQVLYTAVLNGLGTFLGSAKIDPNRRGCGCNN